MAYNAKLGYDPDFDYAAAIQKLQSQSAYSGLSYTQQQQLDSLYDQRQKKVNALAASNSLDPRWATNKDLETWGSDVNKNNNQWVSGGSFGENYYVKYTPSTQTDPYSSVISEYQQKLSDAKAQQQSWYDSQKQSYNNSFDDYMNQLQAQREAALKAQTDAIRSSVEKGTSSLNSQKTGINQSADELARQAYINKMQTQNILPQTLAAQGQSGGATESANIAIGATYGNQLNSVNQQRNNQLRDIDNAIQQLVYSGDMSIAEAAAKRAELGVQDNIDLFSQKLNQYNWLDQLAATKEQQAYANLLADTNLNLDVIKQNQSSNQYKDSLDFDKYKFNTEVERQKQNDEFQQNMQTNEFEEKQKQNEIDNKYRESTTAFEQELATKQFDYKTQMDMMNYIENKRQFDETHGFKVEQWEQTLSLDIQKLHSQNYWQSIEQSNWEKAFMQNVAQSDRDYALKVYEFNLKQLLANTQISNDAKSAALAETKKNLDFALTAAQFNDYSYLKALGININ